MPNLEGEISKRDLALLVVAVVIGGGVLAFLWSQSQYVQPLNLNASYAIDYAGLQVNKDVSISAKGHEERILAPENADLVLLTVVPNALADSLATAEVSATGEVEKLEEYSLVVVKPKEGRQVSLSMRLPNTHRNLSTVTLALPTPFYESLSEEQRTALFTELKGFELVWMPVEEMRATEEKLATRVSGALTA